MTSKEADPPCRGRLRSQRRSAPIRSGGARPINTTRAETFGMRRDGD
jgi:hypothetical protein